MVMDSEDSQGQRRTFGRVGVTPLGGDDTQGGRR